MEPSMGWQVWKHEVCTTAMQVSVAAGFMILLSKRDANI